MSDRVVINIPPMPKPEDYGVTAETGRDADAAYRFQGAMEAWERAVKAITAVQTSKKSK